MCNHGNAVVSEEIVKQTVAYNWFSIGNAILSFFIVLTMYKVFNSCVATFKCVPVGVEEIVAYFQKNHCFDVYIKYRKHTKKISGR